MDKLKVAVMYYSSTGGNHKMAKWAEQEASKTGAEVKRLIFSETAPSEAIDQNEAWKRFRENEAENETEATLDHLQWADVVIFSIPTRYGGVPSQVQAFFDTTGGLWSGGKLTDKVVTGITSAMNPHGGQEGTLQSLYKTMMHWACIIVPPGYTDNAVFAAGGNPYGTSASIDKNGKITDDQKIKGAIEHQVRRTLKIATRLKGSA